MDMKMEFNCIDLSVWKESLSAYSSRIESLSLNNKKPDLVSLDHYYRHELPLLLRNRNPDPFITTSELSQLMRWKLARGKWRPRLLDFVSALDEESVRSASRKAFDSLPCISRAISELTVLKGVGAATASAILAAFAPDLAPFMSDEAMEASLGNSKDYSAKQYLLFANKLQAKAKELSSEEETFTPSDVERALWSSIVGAKLMSSKSDPNQKTQTRKSSGGKRKR